jgi:periplasmic protein TonB
MKTNFLMTSIPVTALLANPQAAAWLLSLAEQRRLAAAELVKCQQNVAALDEEINTALSELMTEPGEEEALPQAEPEEVVEAPPAEPEPTPEPVALDLPVADVKFPALERVEEEQTPADPSRPPFPPDRPAGQRRRVGDGVLRGAVPGRPSPEADERDPAEVASVKAEQGGSACANR